MSAKLPWLAIALGLVVLGAIFAQEGVSALSVWSSSTAYGHCFLVLPIVFWLLWERRAVFEVLPAVPAIWPALLALPLLAMWLGSYWLGIMEGRQLAAMGFVELLLMAALGWRLWWAASAGFLYLFFLVPFGAFLTPMLQHFTASFITHGLALLRIPFEANAFQISIPEGSFYVAEACAGLRFLIAAIAFGVLYAVTMFRSPGRRAVFIAVSCVVPVVANGVRGLGIVVLGHILGSAQAGAADHLIYGWVFFSAVILVLALGGFPFREALAPAPEKAPTAAWGWGRLAGCVSVVVFAGLTTTSLAFSRAEVAGAPVDFPHFTQPAACVGAAALVQGGVNTQDFVCNGQSVRVTFAVLPRGSNPAQILQAARESASRGLLGEVDGQVEQVGGVPWVRLAARDLGGAGAYAVLIDGVQRVGGLRDRLVMARDMFSAGAPPVAMSIVVSPGAPDADALLAAFMDAPRT